MSVELLLTVGVLAAVLSARIMDLLSADAGLLGGLVIVVPVISIRFAASIALISPIGYQTNLIVYGPGNYRFLDFTRVGGPLQVLLWIVLVIAAPFLWPM